MAAITPEVETGWAAPDFCLPGTDGQMHSLASLAGSRGTVVAFICNHCPYVKAILPRLIADARDLTRLGVSLVAINSNDPVAYPEDSFENMVRVSSDWPFHYLFDETQQIAHAYDAVCTPDFFGFDAALKLQYRGRIDATGKSPPDTASNGDDNVLRRELYLAMRQVAQEGRAPAEQIHSIGCAIKFRT